VQDFKDVCKANIRLVLWVKQQNIVLPSRAELVQQFPLAHYD